MRGWAALVLIAAVCVCSGCAKYYYQEGKTFEQCKRDYEECAAERAKREDPDLSLRGFLYGRRRGLAGALSGE
jgi:hypothetical protein